MIIRPIKLSDAKEYRYLRNVNYQWFFSKKLFTEEEVFDWLAAIDYEAEDIYVCEDNNRLIGSASLYNIQNNEAEVGRIMVDPNYKGKGIGLQLLHKITECAKDRQLKILKAEIMLDNVASLRLFQKAGYVEVNKDDEKYTMQLEI